MLGSRQGLKHSKSLGQYILSDAYVVIRDFTKGYQGGVKATVSGVFEDLKFKISEASDQN